MPQTPPKDPLTGQFVRKENDQPISIVLAQEATKRTEREAAEKKRKEQEPEPEKKDALDDAGKQVLDDFLGVDRVGDKTARQAVEKEKVDKAKAERARKKAAAEAADKKVDDKAKADTMDDARLEKVAAAAAEGVARALKPKDDKKQQQQDEPKPTGPEARRLAVLERMAKLYPDEYKDAPKRYREARQKLDVYKKDWEKDNPGQKFDESAPEHEEFYEKNDLFEFWDEDAYIDAAADIRSESVTQAKIEEANREINAQLSELQREKKLRDSEAAIGEQQINAASNYWETLGDDFAEVVKDGTINREKLRELQEADPVGFPYRVAAAKDLNAEVKVIYSLMNGLATYDAKNPVHVAMGDFGEGIEKALMAKPASERRNAEGLPFLPGEDYWKLPKEQRGKHWTLSAQDVAVRRAKVLAEETEDLIKREEAKLEQFAVARGYKKASAAQNVELKPEPEPEEEAEEHGGKPNSPSSASESILAARQARAKKSDGGGKASFFGSY